jgi:hypothetical protein
MVSPDSAHYPAHPDWVLHLPRLRPTEIRHQLVLDFTRAGVRDWAFGWLDGLVRETGLAFLKWDFNRPFTQAGPDAPIAHAEGVYEVLDRLRAAHPGLRVEACAGGGGRADLGILARTDQVWTSDNTDAVDRIAIQHGYTQLYPPGTMVAWVTDSPNALTGRRVPLRFRFHVAMAGVLGVGGDLTRWSDDELEEAAALIAAYREIRPIVQRGELFRLSPPGPVTACQYSHEDHIAVFVWQTTPPTQTAPPTRTPAPAQPAPPTETPAPAQTPAPAPPAQPAPPTATPAPARAPAPAEPPAQTASPARAPRPTRAQILTFPLYGLEGDAVYRDGDGRVFTGEQLATTGLPVALPDGDLSSALIHLVRSSAPR